MTMPHDAVTAESLRRLKNVVAAAADDQIRRIVNMVEELDGLTGGEDLLAPIRARLRPLRPERPLRFTRLLFTPMDPILCDAAKWLPGAATLPRTAIRPLCNLVIANIGERAGQITDLIAGGSARDQVLVGDAGALLWPAAADVLQGVTAPPPEWKLAGLPDASFLPLARGAAGCLAAAPLIGMLADPTLGSVDIDQALSAMLRQAAQTGPTAWGMMLALLLCAVPHAHAPHNAVMVQGNTTALRPAADAALARAWSWIEEAIPEAPLDLLETAAALKRRATLLHWLAGEKNYRAKACAMQSALRDAMLRYVAVAIKERLLGPISVLGTTPDDDAIINLEAEARGLRHLAFNMRVLGGAPDGDAALRNAARAVGIKTGLDLTARVRLVEILDEPDAAMKLLKLG